MSVHLSQNYCYSDARIRVTQYFYELGCISVPLDTNIMPSDKNGYEIFVKPFIYEGNIINLTIALPAHFPDELPKIFIDATSLKKFYPKPHLSKDGNICIFNNSSFPNTDKPVEVVVEAIERAERILRDYIDGKDLTKTFEDEITHYWGMCSTLKMYSLIEPKHSTSKIYIGGLVAATSIKEILNWYKNIGLDTENLNIKPAIYINNLDYGIPPFPDNNRGWNNLFAKQNKEIIKRINTIAKDVDWPITILFSKKVNNRMTWGAVCFKRKSKVDRTAGGKIRNVKNVKGFRAGKAPLTYELAQFPKNKVEIIRIEPVFSDRLQLRGGEGPQIESSKSIMIAGCGSIGSHIAEVLAQSGISRLSVVDPETLLYENVARHVCGANYVGYPKALALKKELGLRFPHVFFTGKDNNILDCIKDEPDWINRHDILICAIGEYNTEVRINRERISGIIKKPIFYVWVEPFLIAGHAIYLSPTGSGCFECLYSNSGSFKHKVLSTSEKFTRREAGCTSSFVPYGITKIHSFVSSLVEFTHCLINNPPDEHIHWTWLGDLDWGRSECHSLEEEWKDAKGFRIQKRFISADPNCICIRGRK